MSDIIDELKSKDPRDHGYFCLKNNYEAIFESIIQYKEEEKPVGWKSKPTTNQILDYVDYVERDSVNESHISSGLGFLNEAGLMPKWDRNGSPRWDFSQIDDEDLDDIEEAYDEVRQYFEEET